MTARRRDRIPCLQACHLSEVALRVQLVSHFFLSIELQVQCPAREPPNLLDLDRGRQLSRSKGDRTAHCSRRSAKCTRPENAIWSKTLPPIFTTRRGAGLASQVVTPPQSPPDSAGPFERGRQWCPFQCTAESLTEKTIRSCLPECSAGMFSMLGHADDEFETAQSRVVNLGQYAMRDHTERTLRLQVVPYLHEVGHCCRVGRSHRAAPLRQRL